jgi:dienelactone hydrolase
MHTSLRPSWLRYHFSPIYISATATVPLKTSAPRCAPPAVSLTSKVLGDLDGANKLLRSQPYLNGKVGVFGTCSGGRHGFLAACRTKGIDALVECWGGGVVMKQEELTPKKTCGAIDYTKDLSCPMIGIFGNDDKSLVTGAGQST